MLTQHIEHNASSGNAVLAVMADPNGAATVSGDLVPFAAMGRGVASRLGIAMPAQTTAPHPQDTANSAAPQPDALRPDESDVAFATALGEPETQPRWQGEPSHTRLVMIARTRDPVLAGARFNHLGTGFLLAPRLILTAAHITNRHGSRGTLKVRNKRGTITADGWVSCRVLWTHDNHDAALLLAEEHLAEPTTDSDFSTPRWAQPTGDEALIPCHLTGTIVSNEATPHASGHLTGILHPTSSHPNAGYEFESAASLTQTHNTKSFARGMSGAPVFFEDFLIGIVIAARNGSRLAVTGISSLVNDREFTDAYIQYMRHIPRLDLLSAAPSVQAGDDRAGGRPAGRGATRVFISYAHEDDDGAHTEQVRKLGHLLRAEGIDIRLDQFPAEDRRDWATWMRQEIEIADVILVIASPAYKRRAEDFEADSSVGVAFEARLLRNELAHSPDNESQRILPVLLPGSTSNDLPAFLRPLDPLVINPITRTGADQLLHRLTHVSPAEHGTDPTAQARRSTPLAEHSAKTKCLPTYLLLDTSASMRPHEAQLNATLDHVYMSLVNSPRVAEFAHISIVTFNTQAQVALEMTDIEEVSALPQLRCSGQTNIGAAFDLVRKRIEVDVPALRGANKAVLRPAVFLLTDGLPTDTATWRRHWNRLVDPAWPRRPHVLTFGFGEATLESLRGMATKAAFLAHDSLRTKDALSSVLNTMFNTLVASAPTGALVVPETLPGFERIPVDYLE